MIPESKRRGRTPNLHRGSRAESALSHQPLTSAFTPIASQSSEPYQPTLSSPNSWPIVVGHEHRHRKMLPWLLRTHRVPGHTSLGYKGSQTSSANLHNVSR